MYGSFQAKKIWQNTVCRHVDLLKVDHRDVHDRVKRRAIGRRTANLAELGRWP